MVKTEGKERACEGRFQHAEETNDVGCWQEENCRSAKAEMGEGQSDGRLENTHLRNSEEPVFRSSEGGPFVKRPALC
jgi:hypothetical protein